MTGPTPPTRGPLLRDAADAAYSATGFLVAIPVSLLPRRYRGRFAATADSELLAPAAVSGLLQLAIFGALHVVLFFRGSYGFFPLLEHLLNPGSAVVGYLALEGFVRGAAAAFAGEVLPTLPLAILAWLQSARERRTDSQNAGSPVPDRVTRGDGQTCDWCVESWRPKPDWDNNPHLVIAYRDAFYEVVERRKHDPPRPYVYLLKKTPEWKLVVRPDVYDPEE